jgi:hypothetical protein
VVRFGAVSSENPTFSSLLPWSEKGAKVWAAPQTSALRALTPLFFEGLAQEFEIVTCADVNVFHQRIVFVADGHHS